jgi:GH24 family phage-related lysozyme (muramidase)
MVRHLLRLAALLPGLILAGCCSGPCPTQHPAKPEAALEQQAKREAVAAEAVAPVRAAVVAAVDALPLPPPRLPPPTPEPCANERAVALIIAFEVGSPEIYTRKYRQPVWPGAASGATWGLGYDGGYRTPAVIAIDWEAHPHHVRLQTAAGITGPQAREVVRKLADVSVDYGLARQVFDQTILVEHCRITRRVFRPEHFDAAHPNTQGAIVSLVFNRGGAMTGPNRIEMRAIRDDCLPRRDAACTAHQLRAMVRIWTGSAIEKGMRNRRYAEADMAEDV